MRLLNHSLLPVLLILLPGVIGTSTANAQADPSAAALYTPPTYHVSILAANVYAAVPNGFSAATGVNANGEVCGYITPADNDNNTYGFFYRNGVVRWLSTNVLGAQAYAINDAGEVVGTVYPPEGGAWAFSYYHGAMTFLGDFPTGTYSECYALNNQGVAAGSASVGSPIPMTQPAIFGSDGPIDLDSSLSDGYVSGINDKGEAVGTYYVDATAVPFIYEDGSLIPIGGFPGTDGSANAVNDAGQVVMAVTLNSGKGNVFLIEPSGRFDDLGRPADTAMATPTSINSDGDIVGYDSSGISKFGGFLYSHGHFYNLQDQLDSAGAGISLNEALWMSDSGQITGAGKLGGKYDLLLLTPDNTAKSPTIESISPVSAQASTKIPMLTVLGSGFHEWSTIDWNNTPLATTFVSSTELTAPAPASVNARLASKTYPGSASIVVVNPAGASAAFSITITEPAL